ncbi:hypothetical protein LIN78_06205 [Leeia sp. TBRC 13508]|uniref:Uncharacterized protein n=1 Tax=Leeia speluncae TaxID=2884804 RepID=A0ABS8D554_9NEIS|nr:hypothetical protein [Leeia speluncae]MCB6183133.1 hypothetical protein [Leeia speluncae]
MKRLILGIVTCLALIGQVQALTIDARVGNLNDPKVCANIRRADAEARLHITDSETVFNNLYEQRPKKNRLPKGISQTGNTLVITAPNLPPLKFKGAYFPPGKNGGESDEEYYVYVHAFEKYHLIAVEYAHDSYDYVLVDKTTLKLFMVDRS